MKPICINEIIFSTVISLLLISSCIDPFSPQIDHQDLNKYVVNGLVTDQEGYQIVSLSLTSRLNYPVPTPITGCSVEITCSNQKVFDLTEFKDGMYRVWMDSVDLIPGNSYKLSVTTPSGVNIVSDFDQMPECPAIDSIYYIRKDLPTGDPNRFLKGIQFYIDVTDPNTRCQFFKWELEETYKYHVPYPREYFYDGVMHRIQPPDYSLSTCWSTSEVKNIFTLSTHNNANSTFKMHPLHFVDNQTSKLLYGYSLLVKQYGLSEAAYTFWEQVKINSNERGGLYETQPLPVEGNLHCVSNSEQRVLGMFSAVSVKSKRISFRNVEGLEIEYNPHCTPYTLKFGFRDVEAREYPIYYTMVNGIMYFLQPSCVDCRVYGGTTNKPTFWLY